ncbi:PREDICTED: uncharacterized protein LOC109234909 [Nicotiana attenuata]|uniref:uncharacterized protein LOC109234909 n=1 Tax=Nicotiana attenuata TaxID=49451 RepID=UPI000904C253|nr:PREDICTED: uncharacterized protein LOC109234909 [Nicotiana attenuata]
MVTGLGTADTFEKRWQQFEDGHFREFLSDLAKNNYGKNREVVKLSKPSAGSPRMMINMIFGGDEVNGVTFLKAKKSKISITHGQRVREVLEDAITVTEEDVDGLILLHDNALAKSLNVLDFKTKRMLVDPGSSTNIIKWRVSAQTKLTRNIVPATKLLAGFNLTSVTTRGEILLPTHAEGVTKTTLFEVVDGYIGYNTILGSLVYMK